MRISSFIFFIILLTELSSFAVTAKSLNYNEQAVVAKELAEYLPAILNSDEATLQFCILQKTDSQGKTSSLQVSCEYTAIKTGAKADAIFDHVQIDQEQNVTAVTFKLLSHQ